MNNTQYKQKGFTVIEVVIAFAILSVVTVVTVGVVTQNTMRTHKIEKRLMAMEIAENAIAEIGMKVLLSRLGNGAKFQGMSGSQMYWKASVNKYQISLDDDVENILPLWNVDLKVFHKEKVLLSLLTVIPGK